ncbi:MAG: T9SS type A sorting domain-containing protein, partial [Chitinophagaceae bacterium]|nr:T9SS type A sorting domain-containing protein [Chitinophagaceae bacterium]
TTSKVWDETTNSWTNSKGSNYTYNENNKLLTTTSKVWDETFPGGKWLIYEKSTNTYDENGFLINNFTKTWDKSTATWINYSRIYYKNYINGLVHKFKQQYWDNIKNCWNNTQQGTFTYTNTTEIIKESNDFSINLYPNPCKEYINLDISNELNSNVEIIDLQGKVVFNKSINENYLSIDLRNFPVNIYFLKIQQGDKSIIKKFIKN